MSKITIKKVNVKLFRNLKNVSVDLGGKNIAFCGNNRIGKTNMLNAIYWCLTGVDLENNSNDWDNIPYDLVKDESESPVIDVVVELSNGTIERSASIIKGSCIGALAIDGVPCKTVKDGEIAIDQKLGILGLTIKQPKTFYVRRFLLNPMYINLVNESALRSFIIGLINDSVDYVDVFEKMPNQFKAKIKDILLDKLFDVESVSAFINSQLKADKDEVAKWKVIIAYLKQFQATNVTAIKDASYMLSHYSTSLNNNKELSIILDSYVVDLSKALDKACETLFDGIKVKLIEKGVGEDVWKKVCYPLIPGTDFALSQGSTSERIIVGCHFLCSFVKMARIGSLPLIFDECETLDDDSLIKIKEKTNTQLITARVVSGHEKMEVIKND